MQSNMVRWFEIYVQDMDRARKFYEAVFHVRLKKLETPGLEYWAFPDMLPDRSGTSGALAKMDGVRSGGSTIVYFACEDCAVEEARVKKAGGQINKPKFAIGQYGFISLIVDTEGNMIGLHSMH